MNVQRTNMVLNQAKIKREHDERSSKLQQKNATEPPSAATRTVEDRGEFGNRVLSDISLERANTHKVGAGLRTEGTAHGDIGFGRFPDYILAQEA